MIIDFLYWSYNNDMPSDSPLWLGQTHVGYSACKRRTIPKALVDFGTILYLVSLFNENFLMLLLFTTAWEFQHGQLPTSSICLHRGCDLLGAGLHRGNNSPMQSDTGSMDNKLSRRTVFEYSGRGDRTCYLGRFHGSHHIYSTDTESVKHAAPQKADADVGGNVCCGWNVRSSFIRKPMSCLLTDSQCVYSCLRPRSL